MNLYKRECREDGCTETRFSQLGMDYHVLRNHPLKGGFDG